jgi:hypothetical protein
LGNNRAFQTSNEQERENRHYIYRLIGILPASWNWVLRVNILIAVILFLSGFGIILDSVKGTFPAEADLLRRLFLFNWFLTPLFFSLSVYLSRKFYATIFSWIDGRQFASNNDSKKKLDRWMNRALSFGFGSTPLLVMILIILVRYFLSFLLEPTGNPGVYGYWYAGTDIMYCFAVLITFWSLILFSGVLHHVASSFPIKIGDVAEYKDNYEEIVKLVNQQILITGVTVGFFLLGILFWAFSVGISQYYLVSLLLFIMALFGVMLISALNLDGIQKGLERTKKTKIASIRGELKSQDRINTELLDLQISLHSNVTLWKVGPKIIDSFLFPLLVAELPILLQSIIEIARHSFG